MAQADGTILIDTEIDADGMKAGSKEVESAARRMANSVDGLGTKAKAALNKQVDALIKLNREYTTQKKKVDDLTNSVEELRKERKPTKEFAQLDKDMQKASQSADKLEEKIAQLNAEKEKIVSAPTTSKDIQKYSQELESVRKKSNDVAEAAEKAFSEKNKDILSKSSPDTIDYLKSNDSEYQKSMTELEKLGIKAEELEDKLEKAFSAQDKLKTEKISKLDNEISSASQELSVFNGKINDLANRMNSMEDSGNAFDVDKLKKAEAQLEREKNKLSSMSDRIKTSFASIEGTVNDYQKSLLKEDGAQKKASTSSKKLSKSLKDTGKSAKTANYGLGQMLKTGLLMSVVFQAFSAVTNAIKEGFTNLAQYSGSTNNSISMLWSSLERLKNSLATAFAPILDVVAPILSKFIDMLSTAASYVSMFFAFLSGKSTYTRAVAVQKNYATSLKDTASSSGKAAKAAKDNADAIKDEADAAEDYLSPLDDINKYTEQNAKNTGGGTGGSGSPGGGGGGGTGSGPLFEEVPIDNKFASLLDTVLDKLKEIRDIFMSGFWDGLGDYKPLLEELKKDLSSIGRYLTDIFTDEDVMAAAKRFATSFIYNLGKIAGSFAKVGLTIAVNIVGGIESYLAENIGRIKNYLLAMFDIGTEVLDTLGNLAASVADIFATVFGSQVAQDLTGDLIGIFATIFGVITQLATGLGRDLLNFIAQPIIENKEAIKTALLETIAPIETIAQAIEDFVQGLADKIMALYNEHLKPFIDSVVEGISKIVGVFLDAYNEYIAPVLDSLAAKFDEVLNGPVGEAINSILNLIGKVIDVLKLLWEEVLIPFLSWIVENIIPIIAPIIEFLGTTVLDFFGTVAEVIGGIADILSGLIDFIVGVFTGDWERAFSGLKQIGEGFKKAVLSIFKFIENNILKPFDNFLQGVFSKDWAKTFGILGEPLNAFFLTVKNIWNSIKQVFNGIITFVKGVFSGNWRQAWEGVKQIFSGVFNSLKAIAKAPINGIISIINGAISGINTLIRGVNRLPFVSIPTIGKIPYLASGAVIPPNREFMAVLGDQKHGNNIEAPESLIRRIVREESGGGKSRYNVSLMMGRREITKFVLEEGKVIQSQTGRNPFELA